MSCTYCGAAKHWARGLCAACYYRQRRNGSVERKYVVNSGNCAVEGCDNRSFAKNLCQSHYSKADHPLKSMWKNLRSRYPGEYPIWWNKFEAFLADVGSRPSPKHQLRRRDHSKPISAENVYWLAPVSIDGHRWTKAEAAAYDKAWALKKKYGISVEEYDRMLTSQNGVCAICGGRETHVHKSGKLKELAVDHDHKTNEVRGLLCMNCNQALGRFQDSMENLHRAIAYLGKSTP